MDIFSTGEPSNYVFGTKTCITQKLVKRASTKPLKNSLSSYSWLVNKEMEARVYLTFI